LARFLAGWRRALPLDSKAPSKLTEGNTVTVASQYTYPFRWSRLSFTAFLSQASIRLPRYCGDDGVQSPCYQARHARMDVNTIINAVLRRPGLYVILEHVAVWLDQMSTASGLTEIATLLGLDDVGKRSVMQLYHEPAEIRVVVHEVSHKTADEADSEGRWIYFDAPYDVELRVADRRVKLAEARAGQHIDRETEDRVRLVQDQICLEMGHAERNDDDRNDAVYNWAMAFVDPFLNTPAVQDRTKRYDPRSGKLGSSRSTEPSSRSSSPIRDDARSLASSSRGSDRLNPFVNITKRGGRPASARSPPSTSSRGRQAQRGDSQSPRTQDTRRKQTADRPTGGPRRRGDWQSQSGGGQSNNGNRLVVSGGQGGSQPLLPVRQRLGRGGSQLPPAVHSVAIPPQPIVPLRYTARAGGSALSSVIQLVKR
jgi:hypothetical protein